jgi:hypothetical protein
MNNIFQTHLLKQLLSSSSFTEKQFLKNVVDIISRDYNKLLIINYSDYSKLNEFLNYKNYEPCTERELLKNGYLGFTKSHSQILHTKNIPEKYFILTDSYYINFLKSSSILMTEDSVNYNEEYIKTESFYLAEIIKKFIIV